MYTLYIIRNLILSSIHRHTKFKGQRNYIGIIRLLLHIIILCCTDLSHARAMKTHMPNLFPSTVIYIDDVHVRGI